MPARSVTSGFRYGYLLESGAPRGGFYTGMTDDLAACLAAPNAGQVSSVTSGRPWAVRVAIAFRDPVKAAAFERYLTSEFGRSFAIRHLCATARRQVSGQWGILVLSMERRWRDQ